MVASTRRVIDPDGDLRILYAGVAGCLGLGVGVSYAPTVTVGLALVIGLIAVAVGLHVRGHLSPLWPLIVMAALQPLNGLRPLPFVAVGDVLLVATGFFVLVLARRAEVPQHIMVLLAGTLVVTAGGLLGMMVAQDWDGASGLAKFVLGAPLVVIIVILINPDRNLAILLATAYAAGAAVSTVAAFFEAVDPEFGRSSGFGAHAGHLALAGIFGFFVFFGWVMIARPLILKAVAAIGAGLCLYGIMLSGTRSALIGFACGVVYLAVAARLRGFLLLGGGAVSLLSFYLFVVPFLPFKNNIQRAFGQGELAGSSSFTTTLHAEALQDAVRLIGRHPWSGVGFSEGQTAHNMILQVASLGGLVALVGLLIVWFPIVVLALVSVSHGMRSITMIPLCMMAGVLAYFVFAQFQPLIWDRHLWFFIALTVYAQVQPSAQTRRGEGLSDGQRVSSW